MKWKVDSPDRLLNFIKKNYKEYSAKDIRWAIEHNRCSVNGFVERFCSYSLKKGDEVAYWPEKRPFFKYDLSLVLYEDNSIIAYNKPPFLDSETLAEYLQLSLIHRLDRDTSGVILLAKTPKVLDSFQNLFRDRSIEKEYLAIVERALAKDEVIIEGALNKKHPRKGVVSADFAKNGQGLWSKTLVHCLKKNEEASLLLCKPVTGRTHQIRAHLKSIGHPILGDFEYGKRSAKENLFRPLLHAKELLFLHPETQKRVKILAPLPEDFLYWQNRLLLS